MELNNTHYDAHIICRFSSQDKEDASIERQKMQCIEVAQKLNINTDNIKIIANDNLSGALPWEKRVDLVELEKDIKQGSCKILIVYRFDRLSRDFEVSGKLLNLLKEYAIKLYDEGGELDYTTAPGQAFFGMKSVFASFERTMIKERLYSGKLFHFKQGKNWGGPLPIGIKRQNKKIVEDPQEMLIVNAMFNYIASGWSIKQIEQWTINNGINKKKPRRKGGICDWSIKGILTNKFYVTGEYTINTSKEGKLTQKIHLSNPVPSDLFDTVQKIIQSRTPGRPTKGTYLLSGLVYPIIPIGEGFTTNDETEETTSDGIDWGIDRKVRFRAMKKNGIPCYFCSKWGELRKKEGYYFIGKGKRQRKQFAFISKDILENKVWNALEKMYEKPEILLKNIHKKAMIDRTNKEILSDLITSKEKEKEQLEITLERFYNVFGLNGDQYDLNKINDTKRKLNKIEKELSELNKNHHAINLEMKDATEILDSFKIIHDLRLNGSPEEKLAFIRKYICIVEIWPAGKIEITGRFDLPKGSKEFAPRWSKGRVLTDTIKSYNHNNVLSSHVVP